MIRQKVDYSPSSRRTVNLSFRHSLGSQPQNSSREDCVYCFLQFLFSQCPCMASLPLYFSPRARVLPQARELHKACKLPLPLLRGCSGSNRLEGMEWIWVGNCPYPKYSTLGYTGGVLVKGGHLRRAYCLLRNPGHAGGAGKAFWYRCRGCQRC